MRVFRAANWPLLILATLISFFPQLASGQNFQIRVTQGSTITSLQSGGTIQMNTTAVGATITATIVFTYTGSTTASVTAVNIFGSSAFTVPVIPAPPPVTLTPGQPLSLQVNFKASDGNAASGLIQVSYTEAATGVGQSPVQGSLTVNLSGTAPNFVFAYFLQTDNNTLPLSPNGTISFTNVPVNTTAAASFLIVNNGSGAGSVTSISVGGSNFSAKGLPLTPATVPAGQQILFTVQYAPLAAKTDTGTVQVVINAQPLIFNLQGTAVGPSFTYATIQGSATTPVTPGQTINLKDTNVGTTVSLQIQVTNGGTSPGIIQSVGSSSSEFVVSTLPVLPVTVPVGGSFTFTLSFTPAQVGQRTGNLVIGGDTFPLTGTGDGVKLTYSYGSGNSQTTVAPGGTVVFSPAQIGATSSLSVTIQNTGTQSGTINSIGIASAKSAFHITNTPSFPLTIPTNGSVVLNLQFMPSAIGLSTDSLQINSDVLTLSGIGTAPPQLPGFNFVAPTTPPGPMQQPAIGLTLSSPYSIPLTGTLSISFVSSSFAADPAVQFVTGGTSVAFSIPANTTTALFAGSSTQIKLQTGTVAGTIVVTPAFSTQSGYDLTPASPTTLSLAVPLSAPVLLSAQVSTEAAGGFTITIDGFSTSRALTSLSLQLTPVSPATMQTSTIQIDASSSFQTWYQSTASQPFGSQFSVAIPINLSGNVPAGASLIDYVQSVAITGVNSSGTSNSVSVSLH